MILEKSEILFREESAAIADIENSDMANIAERSKACLRVATAYMAKLKGIVLSETFGSHEEEITFFKETKPKFAHVLIYYASLQRIELSRPEGSLSHVKDYYERELKGIRRFFELNRHIYAYYRSGDTNLDGFLFLRGKDGPPWLCKTTVDSDERFSTAGDYLFAKIQAKDKLARYLEHALKNPQIESAEPLHPQEQLTWTGDTINLLENAYGWYHTGQVNNGKASIIDIVRTLENAFQVKIGRPYRRLTEIKQRKRLSRTKFIDEMGKTFIRKLDEEDEFRPTD